MTKDTFNRIKEGLEDALAYANGDTSRGRVTVIEKPQVTERQSSAVVKRPAAKKDA